MSSKREIHKKRKMNTSYLWGEDEDWGPRYYFTYYSEFGDRAGASTVEVVVLAVSFVVAVIANLGIAGCVLMYKEMRTPTNLCLVNLASADLVFTLGVPAIAYTRLTKSWFLGDVVCKLLPYSQFVCGFVLLWTLTFISMDRHRCLVLAPYRSALTNPRVLIAGLLTWIVAASVFLPVAFWFRTKELGGSRTICTLVFPRNDLVNVSLCFTIPIVIIACLLPMSLLVYHYQRIFQKILNTRSRWAVPCVAQSTDVGTSGRRDSELSVVGTLIPWAGRKLSTSSISGRQGGGHAGSLSQHEEIRLHKHLRVVRILLLNVVAVLVMWLPITIVLLLIYLDGSRPTDDTGYFLKSQHFVWSLIVAHLNTVVNPLLYGVFSENFRVCFAKLWRRGLENGPRAQERLGSKRKSLEGFQNRLGSNVRTPSSSRNQRGPKKSSSCSIDSIVEVPSTERL